MNEYPGSDVLAEKSSTSLFIMLRDLGSMRSSHVMSSNDGSQSENECLDQAPERIH